VRKIVRELEAMEPERARFVAAYAYILGRVAFADLDISAKESRRMEELVAEVGKLPEEQSLLVVEIAKAQNRLAGGTENFQVTREFKELANRQQSLDLLHCLFAVAAADGSISAEEEAQIRLISDELGFSHREHIEVRRQYNELRSVVQRQKGK
jgi:uncharacterized tellurite resistance protein B-like protein